MSRAFILLALVLLTACSHGGMPRGHCDPDGPGLVHIFEEHKGRCNLLTKTECNAMGRVIDGCEKATNADRRQAYDEFLMMDGALISEVPVKPSGDLCKECADSSACPSDMRDIARAIC